MSSLWLIYCRPCCSRGGGIFENESYHYEERLFSEESEGGYTATEASVDNISTGAETVVINESNTYCYGGTYYAKSEDGYTVVPPTASTTVENLPEGEEEVRIGEQTYVKYGETYYQPVNIEG